MSSMGVKHLARQSHALHAVQIMPSLEDSSRNLRKGAELSRSTHVLLKQRYDSWMIRIPALNVDPKSSTTANLDGPSF
jgi:hypothetical protein